MKLKTLELAVLAWRRAEALRLGDVRKFRAALVAAHDAVLKVARGNAPLPWTQFPVARDFFLQWEAGDMHRVLVQGRRW